MVLTQDDLKDWNMNTLTNYLTERGVTLSGGGSRKADLIRKGLASDLLPLRTLPSQEGKSKEIARRRLLKLKVGCISIPFPEVIMQGWMNDYIYYPNLTMDCLTHYAKKVYLKKVVRKEPIFTVLTMLEMFSSIIFLTASNMVL